MLGCRLGHGQFGVTKVCRIVLAMEVICSLTREYNAHSLCLPTDVPSFFLQSANFLQLIQVNYF